MIGSIRVSWVGTNQRVGSKEGALVASQVDFRVGQLLAVNPDSPLGVSKKGEYQGVELHL
jgi:hypothetical protein